jgi:hypothetical protein
MQKGKQKKSPEEKSLKKPHEKPVSLYPLGFEKALKGLLKVRQKPKTPYHQSLKQHDP